MPAMKTGLFKEQQRGTEIQKEIEKEMQRKRFKIEEIEIVINGLRKDTVHEEIRAVQA